MLDEFQSIAQHLDADFRQSAKITHSGVKGTTRESAVVTHYLSKHLPQKYAVSTGIIVNSNGDSSGQIDVVIYDQFNVPVLQDHSGIKVFFTEQVLGCVEVKSTLDSKELHRIVDSAARFSEVAPTAPYFAFAYSCTISAVSICDKLQDLVDLEARRTSISTIVVLEKTEKRQPFSIASINPNRLNMIEPTYRPGQPYASLEYPTSGEALLSFHLTALAALAREYRSSGEPRYLDYARSAGFGEVNKMHVSHAGAKNTNSHRATLVLGSAKDHIDHDVIVALAIQIKAGLDVMGIKILGPDPQLRYRNGQPTGIDFLQLWHDAAAYAKNPSQELITPVLRKALTLIRAPQYLSEGYEIVNQETGALVYRMGSLSGLEHLN